MPVHQQHLINKATSLSLLSFVSWILDSFWGGFWQLCYTQICIHNSLAGCHATLRCGPITFQTDTRCSHSGVVICLEKGVNYCLCFVLLDLGNAVLCSSKFWVSFSKVLISCFTYLLCLPYKRTQKISKIASEESVLVV